MQLKQIMSKAKTWFSPTDSLVHITQTLSEKHHSCALICQDRVPVGIITERDIVRLFPGMTRGEIGSNVSVGEVMTRNPITLLATLTIEAALEVATQSHLRHLPIVDGEGRLEGVVTLTDIVKAHLSTLQANERLSSENEKLQVQSLQDALTQLPNRRAMEIELRHCDALVERKSAHYCVAIMDLDYFKGFNDHYGHLAGDEALRTVAGLIGVNLRASDKAFRYGGEEFLVLMQDTDNAGARIAAERIRRSIETSTIPHAVSELGMLTLSVGVAQRSNNTSANWRQVVERADQALYQAKEEGRNRVRLVDETHMPVGVGGKVVAMR